MSSDIRDLVRQLAPLGTDAMLLTVNDQERPFATAITVAWVGGQLVVSVEPASAAVAHVLERPFVVLLWPPADASGPYLQVECLADLLGDKLLITPLRAWRDPAGEELFAA